MKPFKMFSRPTLANVRQQHLSEAQYALLDAQLMQEHYASQIAMLTLRIARLQSETRKELPWPDLQQSSPQSTKISPLDRILRRG